MCPVGPTVRRLTTEIFFVSPLFIRRIFLCNIIVQIPSSCQPAVAVPTDIFFVSPLFIRSIFLRNRIFSVGLSLMIVQIPSSSCQPAVAGVR
jgi:hypothetical protein